MNVKQHGIKFEIMQRWSSHFEQSLSFLNSLTLKIGDSQFETERRERRFLSFSSLSASLLSGVVSQR